MDATQAQVLFDLTLLSIGVLALGLTVYALLRARDPQIGWHHHGNVWSAPYDLLDLAVAGIVILYYLAQVTLPYLLQIGALPDATAPTTDATGEAAAENPIAGMSKSALVFASAFMNLALGTGVFCYASFIRGRDPVQLFGLNRLRPIGILGWTAAGFPVLYGFAILGGLLWHTFFHDSWSGQLQETVRLLGDNPDPMLRVAIIIAAVIVAPLVEELIFRGFIYATIKRYSDRFFAAVVSALLFALVHSFIPGMLPLFMLGLALALAYEVTGCLWVSIFLHAAFNALQSLFIISGSGS